MALCGLLEVKKEYLIPCLTEQIFVPDLQGWPFSCHLNGEGNLVGSLSDKPNDLLM